MMILECAVIKSGLKNDLLGSRLEQQCCRLVDCRKMVVFIWLVMFGLANGSSGVYIDNDSVSGIDVVGIAKHQLHRGTGEAATGADPNYRGPYESFENDGPSSTPRMLQEEDVANVRMLKVLRLLPIVGALCCLCGLAGIGAKFFLGAGQTTNSS